MRIAELSRRTGVPVPTIKYYLRERLLPPGELTSPNQANYGDGHARRLRLVRALVDVGGLSIGQVRDVLAAVDDPDRGVHAVLGAAQKRITRTREADDDAARQDARRTVGDLIARRGWRVGVDGPAARTLADVIVALRALGHGDYVDAFDGYSAVCERIASIDLDYLREAGGAGAARPSTMDDIVERMVIGTVLGDAALTAIRRLAHQDASARRFGEEPTAE